MRDDATDAPTPQPKLKPANENPWYVLMTLYGEQDEEWFDDELQEKNRLAWNAWAWLFISDADKQKLQTCNEFDPKDVVGDEADRFRDEVRKIFVSEYSTRIGRKCDDDNPPKIVGDVDLTGVQFVKDIDFSGYFFPESFDVSGSKFKRSANFSFCQFLGDLRAQRVTFSGRTDFSHSRVFEQIDMAFAEFRGGADFDNLTAEQKADFRGAEFLRWATFDSAKFLALVLFSGCRFQKVASFSHCRGFVAQIPVGIHCTNPA
ncbi:pentapeptide repeat-containing protein [Pseudophaeobacter sp.]|uniref:pentapeptide repeat-containing protein n=1 Tax=Pseudophaeobacter sp. TaxID=1971739 RepID=UPI0040594DA5